MIRYTDAARQDVHRLFAQTAEHWPQRLSKTISRLRKFEHAVTMFPRSGQRTRFPDIRTYSLKPLPYMVFYRVAGSEIEVLRIYHAARRPYDPGHH